MAKPGEKPPKTSYSLRLPPDIWVALKARAASDGQSMTEVTLSALRGHLGVVAPPKKGQT